MRILFIAYINPYVPSGVEKKLYGQIRAFEKLGHDVDYFIVDNGIFKLITEGKDSQPLFPVSGNSISVYLALEKGARFAVKNKTYHICYIRRIFCTPFHLKTLRLLKKTGAKLVEELPTYPYDNEMRHFPSLAYRITGWIDKRTRKGYKRYLDFFATYSQDDCIFGVPTIMLNNGYNASDTVFEPTMFPEDSLDIIAVSSMISHHGYERLIKGLAYYKQAPSGLPVQIHLVGEGPELAYYQQLTQQCGLQESIIFYGFLDGKELADVYRKCQMGCGALGAYKIGLKTTSTLKNREYMAQGKLVVYAVSDPSLDVCPEYCLPVSNEDTPIDIGEVVAFYEKVCCLPALSERIHQYAKEHLSWEAQLEKVLQRVL